MVDIVVPGTSNVVEVVAAPMSSSVDIATLGPPGPRGPTGPAGPTGPIGPQGVPGPASMAYSPMIPGRWWFTNPFTAGSSLTLTLDQVVWQPFWSGAMTTLAGVALQFAAAVDTAGNICYFALYADTGQCMPGNLVAEVGNVTTTTTISNASRAVACNQIVTPNTLYWIAYLARGGTAHTSVRICSGGHPLVAGSLSTALPTTSGTSPQNGYYTSVTAFPSTAPAVPSPNQACARLMVLAA